MEREHFHSLILPQSVLKLILLIALSWLILRFSNFTIEFQQLVTIRGVHSISKKTPVSICSQGLAGTPQNQLKSQILFSYKYLTARLIYNDFGCCCRRQNHFFIWKPYNPFPQGSTYIHRTTWAFLTRWERDHYKANRQSGLGYSTDPNNQIYFSYRFQYVAYVLSLCSEQTRCFLKSLKNQSVPAFSLYKKTIFCYKFFGR